MCDPERGCQESYNKNIIKRRINKVNVLRRSAEYYILGTAKKASTDLRNICMDGGEKEAG